MLLRRSRLVSELSFGGFRRTPLHLTQVSLGP
jgi:hypothetical protein